MQSRPMTQASPFLLFAQHGWADTHHAIQGLAQSLAPHATIIAPDLGWWKTWWRIHPLIATVEQAALQTLRTHPDHPWRIIGHSMGGLIWLELLQRHPDWWSRVEALVLVASPVGGADLGRILDPFGWGLGIAADLGANRRAIAAQIAAQIPTLSIAGDVDGGSDRTVLVQSTQFNHATQRTLPHAHAPLKNHPDLIPLIHQFWAHPTIAPLPPPSDHHSAIAHLRTVPGITDAHPRDATRAPIQHRFPDGSTLRLWHNPFGVLHVFVFDADGDYQYGGFVGRRDRAALLATVDHLTSL
ncbi:alpha/beta fold hydrolase [Spirulina major]|uniref:alpha/beta fold hydrolase n=1 Tax=Spirulina major TaxID=270636 RepID=UPI000B000342|nr:alpha/beta fold hydrolase [Spirulina major]